LKGVESNPLLWDAFTRNLESLGFLEVLVLTLIVVLVVTISYNYRGLTDDKRRTRGRNKSARESINFSSYEECWQNTYEGGNSEKAINGFGVRQWLR
jgi:hypothetical protein